MQPRAPRPGSLPALRATNRRRVLEALRGSDGLTQAGLARATGLSAASVSGLVRELVREGEVVTAHGEHEGRRGRLIRLAHDRRPLAVGVDLGRRHVRVVLGTAPEELRAERLEPLEAGARPEEVLARVEQLVRATCGDAGTRLEDVVGTGVAVAWPVLEGTGTVTGHPTASGWPGLPIAQLLGDALGQSVAVENDANLGALAVAHTRRVDQPVVFVKIGSGIGAGVVYRGEVVRGRTGYAGNLGHLTMDPRLSTVCQCGRRGCLETVASLEAVRHGLSTATGAEVDVEELLARVHAGEPVALQVLSEAAELTGRALGWLAMVLDPAAIVIGGPAVAAGEALLAPVRRGYRLAVTASIADTEIGLAPLGERTEAVGALLLALERHVPSL